MPKKHGSLRLVRWPNDATFTGPYPCVRVNASSYEVLVTGWGRYRVPAEHVRAFDNVADYLFTVLARVRDYPHAYRDDDLTDEARKILSAIRGIPE